MGNRHVGVTLVIWTLAAAIPLIAQASPGKPAPLADAFAASQKQALIWQYGWSGFYALDVAYNLHQAHTADNADDRYDARVGAVTSTLGLLGLWRDPLPYSQARQQLEALQGNPDLTPEEKAIKSLPLYLDVAEQEAERQSWRQRLAPLIVNLAAGLTIGVGDHRPRDGAIQFVLGMATSEIEIRTQPTAVEDAWREAPRFSLHVGGARLDVAYRWFLTPQRLGLAFRF